MVVFIDGPQAVGKTTLINSLVEKGKVECYKFPFSEYSKTFDLQQGEGLNGFQLGKDLAALHWLSEFPPSARSAKVVIDRGPLSTVFYSYLAERMSLLHLEKFFEVLEKYQKRTFFGQSHFGYIFITAKNRPQEIIRNKKDGFDDLQNLGIEDRALTYVKTMASSYGLNFIHFENDFSKSIEKNAEGLMMAILKSWGGSYGD